MVTAMEKIEGEREAAKATIQFLEQELVDHTTTPMSIHSVNKCISLSERTEATLMEIHTRIVQMKPTDILLHTNEYHSLMKRVTASFSSLQGIKAGLNPTGAGPSTSTPSGTTTNSDIRLPRFNIPKFNGNLLDWVQFRDLFQTVIHNNTQLSDAQKLAHLKSFLDDEPARLIKTMILTDANYSIAWDLLVRRYHNERELLFAVFRRFFNQASVQSQSAESIRKLIDITTECIQQLQVLSINKDVGLDAMLLYSVSAKLDQTSKELWEQTLKDTKIPTLQSLFDFLETRARSLSASCNKPANRHRDDHQRKTALVHHANDKSQNCKVCATQSHPIYKCSTFIEKTPRERQEIAKGLSLCFNCLRSGHSISNCSSNYRCRTCNGKHNTLIHQQTAQANQVANTSSNTGQASSSAVQNFHSDILSPFEQLTILSTAIIRVLDGNNNFQQCRAFLDAGSTASFITSACAQRLHLFRRRSNVEVIGLSASPLGYANAISTLVFKPRFPSPKSFSVEALIMPRVTGRLPVDNLNTEPWTHLHNLRLADPHYHRSAAVDILLGSDIFWDLLLNGKHQGSENTPTAVNSSLGWLVGGKIGRSSQTVQVHYANVQLENALQRFWELESIPYQPILSDEEREAEVHFVSTFSRDSTGRFTVKIPWRKDASVLGDSRAMAVRRLMQLERRLPRDANHHASYISFMKEYHTLGHMELVPADELMQPRHPVYYIPHHYVLKADSTTTKFRVVFDASAKTSSGVSLNQQMLVGPTIQDNLTDIVMRFRCKPIAFTADIGKMYRQILLTDEDKDRHRILWRYSPQEQIKEYRLVTVAYGTASAPFLATRVLQQLAKDEQEDLPLAAAVAISDFYVDDLMAGANSVEEAIRIKDQLLDLMQRGQLQLRKWASNSQQFLRSLPEELREFKSLDMTPTTTSSPTEQLRSDHHSATTSQTRKEGIEEETGNEYVPLSTLNGEDFAVKCLGIFWNTTKDVFQFRVSLPESALKTTKRTVLSEMSQLYDPLGWLSPVIITAKIFMQSLWKLDVEWDTQLPENYTNSWKTYKTLLLHLSTIAIPRCVLVPNYNKLVLAGFSDASERAFSAVVYLCAYYDDNQPIISLICSKTRVAPARKVSLPRLELCGAVTLSQLLPNVQKGLSLSIDEVKAWTDSTVVLSWIRTISSTLQTFVGNRVSEIQTNIPSQNWYHIPGKDNPADCASRGITPSELKSHPLWWNGPAILLNPYHLENSEIILTSEELKIFEQEKKREVLMFAATTAVDIRDALINKFSSFKKLINVTAYLKRFIQRRFYPTSDAQPLLSCQELQQSLHSLVRRIQEISFPEDLYRLTKGLTLSSNSKLLSLSPFLDNNGLIRVGGRLRHSSINANQKHPILLPRHHRFVDLLIQSKHIEYFHAGPQLLQSLLQQDFWIIRGKDAIRFSVKRCITCRKQSARTMQTMMGDLPAARVNPGRPFLTCGVDYAGPFILKSDAPRSKTKIKAYLCIFVCFTTRAVHLEIASSLSTDAFIASLRRFVSRRNKPATIYSDCGTNFVGAAREIKEITSYLMSQSHNDQLTKELSNQGIQWKFNPPGAPHFGGLWEAGVKSVKHHLYRVMGSTSLNFEEMTTLMCQIEACLNSRPLTPISTCPDDLQALTPGHFLTGGPLGSVPQADLRDINFCRLDRWQLLQQKTQEFWSRWSNEYISRLQQRPKWMKQQNQLSIDDLVIIKDERMPPQKWKLGRVIQIHPGSDGITRVVTLKTSEGELKRPIAKLCLLPINNDDNKTN